MDKEQGNAVAIQAAARPKLMLYHANQRGTGSALTMEVHPAHGVKPGCIMMSLASQQSAGSGFAAGGRFDWERKTTVKLDFLDLCKMLQVLRGECESIDDGKGLFHVTSKASTKIRFRHMVEPAAGYSLEVYRTPRDGGEESRAHFLLSQAEATGVVEAIAGSMAVVCFGVPVVVPHDTSAYEAEQRRFRDERAA